MPGSDDEEINEIRKRVRSRLEQRPESWAERAKAARELRLTILKEIASSLEPVLNAEASARPQDTLEEKQDLATWLNRELRELGLAVACPPSQLPGIVVADAGRTAEDGSSRFRIEAHHPDGRRVRSASTAWVPSLELVVDPPRREGGSRRR